MLFRSAGEVPDLAPATAIEALRLCFAVYQASNERRPVELAAVPDVVSPIGWPPGEAKLRADVEAMMAREAAREERLRTR